MLPPSTCSLFSMLFANVLIVLDTYNFDGVLALCCNRNTTMTFTGSSSSSSSSSSSLFNLAVVEPNSIYI